MTPINARIALGRSDMVDQGRECIKLPAVAAPLKMGDNDSLSEISGPPVGRELPQQPKLVENAAFPPTSTKKRRFTFFVLRYPLECNNYGTVFPKSFAGPFRA